ncbi:MAG: CopG family ribbon-helix-helix protein [Ignavibacteriales bacterium]
MTRSRRIMISVPAGLLQEVDGIAALENGNRSEIIRSAVRAYIDERKRREVRESMCRGYVEMGPINLSLAELGMGYDRGIDGGQDE